MKRPADHVVVQRSGAELACLHCGQTLTIALPCAVSVWHAIVQEWMRLHRKCPAPSAPEEARP